MPTLSLAIHQLLLTRTRSGPQAVARSDGVPAEWDELAVQIATEFGPRPAGVKCPAALFACPFGPKHVAVVQVADLPPDGGDPPLGFRFLILEKLLYAFLGDPFEIADRFPPDWSAKRSLATLEWPPEVTKRTVEQVRAVLQTGDGPLLLGSAQALVDGARIAWARAEPDDAFFRGLWQLLPFTTRWEFYPATFAFSNGLKFHAAALAVPADDRRVLGEEQVRDYPEGRYEYNLQHAAEMGDQAELDRLFARRSSRETLRLALVIFALVFLLIVAKVLLR
ncbi:MAG TPA: hypothetical protein VGJ05_16815 [Fimbriiglobus sp.]|jgi:hypothetical protein